MTRNTRRLMTALSIATAVGSAATVAIRLYRTLRSKQAMESRLDHRLEDSMDCSDATASY